MSGSQLWTHEDTTHILERHELKDMSHVFLGLKLILYLSDEGRGREGEQKGRGKEGGGRRGEGGGGGGGHRNPPPCHSWSMDEVDAGDT